MTAKDQRAVREFRSWPKAMQEAAMEWMQAALAGHASIPNLKRREKRMFQRWWQRFMVKA